MLEQKKLCLHHLNQRDQHWSSFPVECNIYFGTTKQNQVQKHLVNWHCSIMLSSQRWPHQWYAPCFSGVATGGSRGQSATPNSEKFAKNREKEGKIGKKRKNREEKGKNLEGSFTLPLLTDMAGYATALLRKEPSLRFGVHLDKYENGKSFTIRFTYVACSTLYSVVEDFPIVHYCCLLHDQKSASQTWWRTKSGQMDVTSRRLVYLVGRNVVKISLLYRDNLVCFVFPSLFLFCFVCFCF